MRSKEQATLNTEKSRFADVTYLRDKQYQVNEDEYQHAKLLLEMWLSNESQISVTSTQLIRVVEHVRSMALQNSELGSDALATLQKIAQIIPINNSQQILKLEAFYALRYLQQQGNFVGQLNSVVFEGCVNYLDIESQQEKGKKHFHSPPFIEVADLSAHTETIQKYWPLIQESGNLFAIDPCYIAAIISQEAEQQRSFKIYSPATLNRKSIRNEEKLADALEAYTRGNLRLRNIATRILWFIENHSSVAKFFLPSHVSQRVLEVIGLIMHQNPTVGLGQLRIGTAQRLELVRIFGNKIPSTMPDLITGILLYIPSINIAAVAAYTRHMVDDLIAIQEAGLNYYLPDVTKFNPSLECIEHKLNDGDPINSVHWAISGFASMYSFREYARYQKLLATRSPEEIEALLRFTETTYGLNVYQFFRYYSENEYLKRDAP